MTLFRVVHNKNYTVINNTICTDVRLSWKAKGLWLSRPDDWTFYLSDIIKQSTDGKDSVSAGLKELEKAGYLRRRRHRDEKGQFGAAEWTFLETPSMDASEPKPDFPILENPILGNPPLLSTESLPSIEKQQQTAETAAAVVVFSCLKNLDIPEGEKAWISQLHKEEDVIKSVAWATAPTTKITTTLERAIKWWLKSPTKPIAEESEDDRTHRHRKFSQDLQSKISSPIAKYVALSNHIEIITTTTAICLDYKDSDFLKNQDKQLTLLKFVRNRE